MIRTCNRLLVNQVKMFGKLSDQSELELFKAQLDISRVSYSKQTIGWQQTYEENRLKVQRYRSIFFFLAFCFLLLSITVYHLNIYYTIFFLGEVHLVAKGALCTISLILALAALLVGRSISVAKEAALQLTLRAKRRLTHASARKAIQYNLPDSIWKQEQKNPHSLLKQIYKEALDKIAESKQYALFLLYKIEASKEIDLSMREQLFNQALIEIERQLKEIIQAFEKDLF